MTLDYRIWSGLFLVVLLLVATLYSNRRMAHEMTQRKQTELQLHEMSQRLQNIADHVPGVMYQYEYLPDHQKIAHFSYLSGRCKDIFEVEQSLILDEIQVFLNMIHPDDLTEWQDTEQEALIHGTDLSHTVRIITPSGRHKWIELSARQNPRKPHQTVIWNGFILDVTERKQAEQELIHARQAAEAANCAKSAFLANMSHELRTPLNAVLGYAQILQRDSHLDTEQQRSVTTIKRSGDYLLTLINDVLDLSKIEAGRFELNAHPCELKRFFAELSEVFNVRAQDKGILFHYHDTQDMPSRIKVDEKRLRQICMNLLGNAMKFTEQGEVCLDTDYQDDELIIQVKDTGIGIPANAYDEIFKPFRQSGHDQYKQQGTGLGLAITRHLVQQMDGVIGMRSQVGVGSCFKVKLPLPILQEQASLQKSPPSFAKVEGYQRLDGETRALQALVVDDLDINRLVLRKLLHFIGFEVTEANDGDMALAVTEKQVFDVIFMDLVMPEVDGLTATRHILERKSPHNRLVIAVSARAFEEDRTESLSAGCCAHITKPISSDILLQTLDTVLSLQWVYQQPDTPPSPPPVSLSAKDLEHLEQALIEGQRTHIFELLTHIKQQDAALGACMENWVDHYDYDRLLEWIHQHREA